MADEPRNKAHEDQEVRPGPGGGDGDDARTDPFGLFPIVVILVLVVGGLFLLFKLREMGNIQDCVSSGRRNCVPVDVPTEK
jgi:hypothetical protein